MFWRFRNEVRVEKHEIVNQMTIGMIMIPRPSIKEIN